MYAIFIIYQNYFSIFKRKIALFLIEYLNFEYTGILLFLYEDKLVINVVINSNFISFNAQT